MYHYSDKKINRNFSDSEIELFLIDTLKVIEVNYFENKTIYDERIENLKNYSHIIDPMVLFSIEHGLRDFIVSPIIIDKFENHTERTKWRMEMSEKEEGSIELEAVRIFETNRLRANFITHIFFSYDACASFYDLHAFHIEKDKLMEEFRVKYDNYI